MSKAPRTWRVTGAALCGCALTLAGCLTLEQMAPPVGPRLSAVAAQQGASMETLTEGRIVYITDCARCHSVEPIGRYSSNRWRKILPRMSLESKLSERRANALAAYVSVARAVLDDGTTTR